MRDYDNMPKINWRDDKSTLARIKAQVSLQEPLVIHLPDNFKLTFDAAECGCKSESKMQLYCQPQALLTALAETNDIPGLVELGALAHEKGQVVDIDLSRQYLIIYD